MLRAPYQLEPEFRYDHGPAARTRKQGRPGPSSELERDVVLDEAFIALDARIRMLHLWSTGVREMSSSPELDWCIACLADVRGALYELHVHVVQKGLPTAAHGPAIVSYLTEAYVWCGDVLEDVQALVHQLRYGTPAPAAALADESSAYIDEFLEPLFRGMCRSWRDTGGGLPSTNALLPLAERLHVAIVSLNWVLRAARRAA